MANHVPRLGRRSLSPFNSKQRNGFRFFGGVGDGGASGEPARNRNLAKWLTMSPVWADVL